MISRARAVVTGLAALAALIAIVAGLPVLLYRFGGSPLPHHVSWRGLATFVSSRDSTSLLLAVVRDCSWIAWVVCTLCVAAEVQATVRGRHSPQLRLGGVQSGVARLVALAALTFTSPAAVVLSAAATPASAASGPVGLPAGPAAREPSAAPEPGRAMLTAVLAGMTEASVATHHITVHSGDCLWSIAQRYLGDGDRYPEIVRLNLGHEMEDGQVFTNPALIQPGWQLLLPGGPHTHPVVEGGGAAGHSGHATNDPHYRARHAAAGHVPVAHVPAARASEGRASAPHVPAARASEGRASAPHVPAAHASEGRASAPHVPAAHTPDRHAPDVPAVRSTGGHRQSAAGGGSQRDPASGRARQLAGTGEPNSQPSPGSAEMAMAGASSGQQGQEQNRGDGLEEAAIFGAGGLAGAVLTSLARLRYQQRQARRRGRRIALSDDPGVLAAEQHLRADAQAEDPRTLQDALAELEQGILADGRALPDIVGLHVTPGTLEVLLSAPALDSPPPPYAITPGRQGMCWQLDLAGDAASKTESVASRPDCHLLPGLFTAGATASGYLLLDLEALRITGCDGPADLVDQVISTVATELATGQWSGWYELVLVGCAELDVLGRAEHCDSLDDALALLADRNVAVARRLTGDSRADLRQLRLAAPQDEDWGLTILISMIEPTEEQMARLMDLAVDGPGGIAALVAGDQETPDGRMASTVLQLAPDPQRDGGIVASVVPLQLTIRPRALSATEYEAITTMFAVAADTADVDPDDSPYVLYSAPPWIPQAAALRSDAWTDEARLPDGMAGRDEMDWPDSDSNDRATSDGTAADGATALGATALGATALGATSNGATSNGAAADRATPGGMAAGGMATGGMAANCTAAGGVHAEPHQLQVKILGPFTITGAADQLQPKQAELVLALALAAPAGLTNSALCSMLGADPDHPKPGDAVRQIITRTRRRLGRAPDGQEYIIHTGNGRYVLHPDAALDWTDFRSLTATAQLADLRAAVALVRGQPFGGGFSWWIDIPLLETVRAEVVDAAEALAEFELASGSPRAAARAARTGLLAEASAEQLWRALMRAEHAASNLAGVTEAWRRCLDAIEDIAPGGEPHPDTAALYRQLTMPTRQRSAAR